MTIEDKRAHALNAAIAYANMQINIKMAAKTKEEALFTSALSDHAIGSLEYIEDLSKMFMGYIDSGLF